MISCEFKEIKNREPESPYSWKGETSYLAIVGIDEQCGRSDISEEYEGLPVTMVNLVIERSFDGECVIRLSRYVEKFRIFTHGNVGRVVVEIDPENPFLESAGKTVYTKRDRRLAAYLSVGDKVVEIPGSIRSVPAAVFDDMTEIEKVIFNEGVERIEDNAFSGSGLIEAILPKSLRFIGQCAFEGCTRLERIDLEYVKEFGVRAFMRCEKLDNIKLTCRNIPCALFAKSSSLENLVLENTETIGDHAFAYTKLRQVTLPETVRELGEYSLGNNVEVLKLPKNIAFINKALTAMTVEAVQEKGTPLFSGKVSGNMKDNGRLVIRSPKDGRVMCEIMAFGNIDMLRRCNYYKPLGFDTESYDNVLVMTMNAARPGWIYHRDAYHAAFFRLNNPYRLKAETRIKLESYLNDCAAEYVEDMAFTERNIEALEEFEFYKGISQKDFLRLIDLASKRNDAEITALLLQKKSEIGKYSSNEGEEF